MGYEFELTFELDAPPASSIPTVKSLLDAGWRLDNGEGAILFATHGVGYDIASMNLDASEEATFWRELELAEGRGDGYTVYIRWGSSDVCLIAGFRGRSKRNEVGFLTWYRRQQLAGMEPTTDHNWYISRLMPAVAAGESFIVAIKCTEG